MSEQPPHESLPDVPEIEPVEHIAPESTFITPETDTSAPTAPFTTPTPIILAPMPDDTDEAPPIEEVEKSEESEESAPIESSETPIISTAAAKAQPKRSKPSKPSIKKPQRKERYTLVTIVSALRSLIVTFAAAVIVATIFMWWTSPDFLSAKTQRELAPVLATAERVGVRPTDLPTPFWFNRVGVVAGHSGIATYGLTKGNVDPGAVCPDGFTEASVTMKVAQQVVASLQGRGFSVDLLEEFDPRLDQYQGAAFISLHADSCDTYDDGFNHSGFKVASPVERFTVRDQDQRLESCMRENYGPATGLQYAPGEITDNMTKYHAFHNSQGHSGIAQTTPAIILELGLLSYDRDLLEHRTDKVAQGIVNGLLCYLQPSLQATITAAVTPVPATLPPVSTAGQPVPTAISTPNR
ncbi:MAG: N-acetylmuramoyl-L-alanine amidase [Chloroflexota bacterium]